MSSKLSKAMSSKATSSKAMLSTMPPKTMSPNRMSRMNQMNRMNSHDQQRDTKQTGHQPVVHDYLRYKWQKLTTIVGYTLCLGSAALALSGCQSSPIVPSSASAAKPMIDFDVTDSAQNQAQGLAFNARMTADAERYTQLFDQNTHPNTDNQAKAHLLTALRQHLSTEHVAVAQANYHMAPFIDPDSIDAGASSLLKTLIETYAYTSESKRNASDSTSASDDDYNDDSNNNDSIGGAEADTTKRGAMSGFSGLSKPSELAKTNAKDWLQSYEAMQQSRQQPRSGHTPPLSALSTGVIGQMLSMLHRTPEQIAAANAYQYQHLTFHSVSQYKPKQRQLQSVYSYDYATPTISSSLQIPLAFDFNNNNVTLDPSVLMPIVALANPEHTPLPSEMASHTVSFGLPDSVTSQLPPAVLYDAMIAAIQLSMAELAPEHFSAVDIDNDAFAQDVGASRAVKVYFGSQQSGEMIGKTLKYMTQSLQEYVDNHPQKYPDGTMLKAALKKLQLYHKGYQSADVGALLQLIEAIGPISFNQINYYYLDRSDRLLAKQQRVNIGADLMGSTTSVLNQVRYDKSSFDDHTLTPLLAESFGKNAKPALDGNAWLTAQRQQKNRLKSARKARYGYRKSALSEGDHSYDYKDNSDDAFGTDASDSAETTDRRGGLK